MKKINSEKCVHDWQDDGDNLQIVCIKCGERHDVDLLPYPKELFKISGIYTKPMSEKEFERFMNGKMTTKEQAKIMKRKSVVYENKGTIDNVKIYTKVDTKFDRAMTSNKHKDDSKKELENKSCYWYEDGTTDCMNNYEGIMEFKHIGLDSSFKYCPFCSRSIGNLVSKDNKNVPFENQVASNSWSEGKILGKHITEAIEILKKGNKRSINEKRK